MMAGRPKGRSALWRRRGTVAVLALVITAGPPGVVAAAAQTTAPVGTADAARGADDGRPGSEAANGRLPAGSLRSVAGILLAPDAAEAFALLLDHAERDGVTVRVTDGYRSFEEQVDVKRRKPSLAATPGTSQHGWGVAIDLDTAATDMAWLRANAPSYGWVHPVWARPGGSKPEPWHWEFVGLPDSTAVGPTPPLVLAAGDHVADLRLEPVDGEPSGWIEVREGLDDLADGARHYPGTAGPGGRGNFAVAGYHRRPDAALAGVERLVAGDVVRVRSDAGEHTYVVVKRATLGLEDGWAVGPDPLETGTPVMLTLTTGGSDDRLRVVWARRS